MKKIFCAGIVTLSLLLSLFPSAYAAEAGDKAFTTVSVSCPEAEDLFENDYVSYANLLMRYADDKTPIPLSAVSEDPVFATIPTENASRPLEYFVSEELKFTDAPDGEEYSDDSYYFYVMGELSRCGVIKGNEKGEALPMQNITRAEAVAMVMRLLGVDNMPDTDSGFSDVPADAWFAAAVTKARKLGVVAGDDETHFSPMRDVSREEMVALVARCFWISGLQKETAVTREALSETGYFNDCADIDDWALSAYGTIQNYGSTDYTYDEEDMPVYWAYPKNPATRFFAADVISSGCGLLQVYPTKTAISYGFDKAMPKIDGSTSTYPFTQEVYYSLFHNGFSHPDMPQKHSKSHASYERLINGEVDMIFASVYPASDIEALAKEKGVELEIIPIAYDAMIFFTNADNPADGLTKKQISEIYVDNKYSNWKDLGGEDSLLYPYCRNNDSGSHAQMERHFLNGHEINEKIRTENTSEGMSNILTDVMDSETEDPTGYGLGYSIYYYFHNMDDFYDTTTFLKLLEIDGVYPDDDTIASGEYPLSNNTYLVMRKDEPQGSPARKMAEYMLTKDGQACVEAAGFGALHPTNPKEFKYKRLSEKKTIYSKDGKTELVTIDAAYPQINAKEETAFINLINKTFTEVKDNFIGYVEDFCEEIPEYFDTLKEGDGELDMFPYENDMYYNISRNTGGIFSITFEGYLYAGGVHPVPNRLSFTYDTNTEKELYLSDILDKSEDETDAFVIEKFYEEYEDEDLWNLEEEAGNVEFYIDGDNLVMYFQPYQIAPFAAGFPDVVIPLDEIE